MLIAHIIILALYVLETSLLVLFVKENQRREAGKVRINHYMAMLVVTLMLNAVVAASFLYDNRPRASMRCVLVIILYGAYFALYTTVRPGVQNPYNPMLYIIFGMTLISLLYQIMEVFHQISAPGARTLIARAHND